MRRALTLIELILSMVIIGIVFTVIPKLIMSMNQSAQTTIKEEAMFNAMAQMGAIINLPWDENNTAHDQILDTNATTYKCNATSGYRIGGFIGGRHCRPASGDLNLTASTLGHDNVSHDDYNDIDDYDNNITTPSINCNNLSKNLDYNFTTTVYYVQDPAVAGTIIFDKNQVVSTTNTKYIAVKKGLCTLFEYHSFNIGLIEIKKREDW